MLGIIGIVVIQMSVYPTIRSSSEGWSSLTDAFPEAFKEMFRMSDYTSERGYLTTELMTFVVPFIFIGLGCTWGARITTEDEESGFADIALALPISRVGYLVSRFTAGSGVLVATSIGFVVTAIIGAQMLGMSIPVSAFIAGGVCLFLLGFITMAMSALIGAWSGNRGASLGISMSIAIASFLMYSLAPLVDVLDATMPVNFFQWTIGTTPLFEGFNFPKMFLTAGVGIVFSLLTLLMYDKRNIAG